MDKMPIAKCSCIHPYQDKIYGYGNRVMNNTKSGQLRCTVCNTLHGSQTVTPTPVKIEKTTVTKVEKSPVMKTEKSSLIKTSKDTKKEEKKPKPSLKGGKR
jgi:hypothetical protein